MTKLEEEIAEVIENAEYADDSTEVKAHLIAEVAKKYIEKAYDDGEITGEVAKEDSRTTEWIQAEKDLWLKENGVI